MLVALAKSCEIYNNVMLLVLIYNYIYKDLNHFKNNSTANYLYYLE